jgi:acyl-[acyl-carrier-protein]-phospholipid O-acyltransferase/long-chain-fatty-acid--[acyl-carrier-protein] ligase
MFWLIGGLLVQIVNALGKKQLVGPGGEVGLSDARTSFLTAITSLGIAVGAIVAGRLSRGRVDSQIVRFGAWGIVAGLVLLSLPGPGADHHLLGFWGSLPALVLLGAFAGTFAVPVQVFIQSRPPADQKGRMIAVMNQMNFVAILLSGVVYYVFVVLVDWLGWPRSPMFAFSALLMLPVAILYRPSDEELT